MKVGFFIFLNIAVLPLIILLGGYSHFSIFLFWIASLILGLLFIKPVIKKSGVLHLLSPCMLIYFYSIVNYVLGSLYYCTDFLSSTRLYDEFFKIDHSHLLFILIYLNLCNSLVAVIGTKYSLPFSSPHVPPQRPFRLIVFILLIALFIILHVFIFDLSIIGGSAKGSQITKTGTEMNYPFIMGIIILLVYKLNTYRTPALIHLLIVFAVISMMAVDSVGSKRELFFILIAILIIELIYHDRKIRLTLKGFFLSCIILFAGIYYILSASIVRGYGGFDVEELSEAASLVSEYADNENFQTMVGNNFEIPYHYATSVLSCDYTLTGKTPILFGETFIRVLFIAVPRSIYKPRKMIDVFTIAYDAQKRKEGVSYPVSAYSEFFANFHIFSIPFVYIFFVAFQWLYIKMVRMGRKNNSWYIYIVTASALSLQFIRGSGFESLVIYSLMAGFSIFVGELLLSVFESKQNKSLTRDRVSAHY